MSDHPADQLLRQYQRAGETLSSPRQQNLVAHEGLIPKSKCSGQKCSGKRRLETAEGCEVWKCSKCHLLWPLEKKNLLRNEFQDGRRARSTFTHTHTRLADLGLIFGLLERLKPTPFYAWRTHVLEPYYEATEERPAEGLGVPLDQLPKRLLKLSSEGRIPPIFGDLSQYRVEQWIADARAFTMKQVRARGRA